MIRDTLFSRKTPFNPSKSRLWVEIFIPFSHQHLTGFFTQFLLQILSNLVNLHKSVLMQAKMKFFDK
jgi:hypothetical protein